MEKNGVTGGMKMKKPKFVFFDYGQTLCTELWEDPRRGYRRILEAARENPHGVTEEELAAAFRRTDERLRRLSEDPWQTGPELSWQAYARYTLESLDLAFDIGYQELEELCWYGCSDPTRPTEGIEDLLAFLRRAHIGYGVVSNLCFSERTLRKRLKKCLPQETFPLLMVSSAYAFRKPMAAFYELALHKAGAAPQEAWFCGDNAVCDVDGPAAVGMQGVWYTGAMSNPESLRLHPQREGWIEIQNWKDLEPLLGSLEG